MTMPLPLDLRLMQLGAKLLLTLLVLAVLAVGLVWLLRSPWFAFSHIRVEGEVTHNNVASIRANALPKMQGGYLTMDLQAARLAFESVPWVRKAVVRRVWPHTLVVSLEEHRPVAYWERDLGEDQLVNQQGELFEVNLGDVEDAGLPTLRGPDEAAAQVWSMYQALAAVFAPREENIERLVLSERGSWKLTLDSGSVIELGRGAEADVVARTRRFAASLPQITTRFGQHRVEYADLRHHEGYALRLAGMGTLDAAPGKKR